MTLLPESVIAEIEGITLDHYEKNAESFWQGTRDHDVSQNIKAFLQALPQDNALDVLDLGCGPGRDLLTFRQLGHRPTGVDGSKAFCDMARKNGGCPVLHQSFSGLMLGEAAYDGIFANASLFHVPSQLLPGVLDACHSALRPEGIMFTSNPRGNAEGWQGNRYGHYMEFEESSAFFEQAGFVILHHYFRPEGAPRNQQPWLAIVCKKQ
jgi:SAM-dependent methyltransferase